MSERDSRSLAAELATLELSLTWTPSGIGRSLGNQTPHSERPAVEFTPLWRPPRGFDISLSPALWEGSRCCAYGAPVPAENQPYRGYGRRTTPERVGDP